MNDNKNKILTLEQYIERHGEEKGTKLFNKRASLKLSREQGRSLQKKIYTIDDLNNGDAIKCMECGALMTRIQWTHFKYKCTSDSIRSIKQYSEKYPGSILISPNLLKLLPMTLENMITKYGEEEGNIKWREYCDKQATTNTFEYKQEKYGWSKEQFDEYNSSRAVTKENLINRHGEEKGLEKWENYCEKQRYTTSEDYFIEKYGEEEGSKKYNIFKKERITFDNKTSNIEMSVYNDLKEYFPNLISQHTFSWFGGAFDYVDLKSKKAIEFYGDFWHYNPIKYKSTDKHRIMKISAEECWQKDKRKVEIANNNGYKIFIIWEHDWCNNQQIVINDLIKWWNNP